MPTYRKVYNVISKCMFALQSAYWLFAAVCFFLPFDANTSLVKYYRGGYVIIPLLAYAILTFAVWCSWNCSKQPLLSFGMGVFSAAFYIMVVVLPVFGMALDSIFTMSATSGVTGCDLLWYAFEIAAGVHILFCAYSVVVFVCDCITKWEKMI